MGYYGMHAFGAGTGLLIPLLILGVLALVLLMMTKHGKGEPLASGFCSGHAGRHAASGSLAEDPRDIVRLRYARGEIDREQYEEAMRLLAPTE